MMTNTEFLAPIRALCVEYDMLPRGKCVLLALSGGMDSMALLHALLPLRELFGFSLHVAHFNHHLRGEESQRDADFVKGHCESLQIPLTIGEGDVHEYALVEKRGVEDAARNLRYAFLEDVARQCNAERIATAHHADDNLETMLLHFARGAGLRGLRGIAPLRGSLVRPLLSTPRAAIERFVREEGIPYVEDSSNQDQQFGRNRIRHSVLPLLRDMNPGLTQASITSLRTLREDEAYLEAQAAHLFRAARPAEDGMVIEVSILSKAPRALASRVLRRMLEEIEAPMPSWVHLNGILFIASGADPAAALHLPGGILVQRIYADLLIAWDYAHEPLPPPEPISVDGRGDHSFGNWVLHCRQGVAQPASTHWQEEDWLYLRRDGLGEALCLRSRRQGDELALPGRRRKSLKKLMIEEKIPRRLREGIPVLADEHGLLAVAGLGVERSRLAAVGEDCLAIQFQKIERDEG